MLCKFESGRSPAVGGINSAWLARGAFRQKDGGQAGAKVGGSRNKSGLNF